MAGTYVRDALAPDLLAGATLNSAGTTTGTIVDLNYPLDFAVELSAATATGTTPTLDVEVQASDSPTFAGSATFPTEVLGRFSRVTVVGVKRLRLTTNKRYVRTSVVVGGTTPSFASSTAKVIPYHDRRAFDSTA